jgi:hypothetical protein
MEAKMDAQSSDLKNKIISEIDNFPEESLSEVLHFVEALKGRITHELFDTALMSEDVLKRDWLRPEEDLAWQDL